MDTMDVDSGTGEGVTVGCGVGTMPPDTLVGVAVGVSVGVGVIVMIVGGGDTPSSASNLLSMRVNLLSNALIIDCSDLISSSSALTLFPRSPLTGVGTWVAVAVCVGVCVIVGNGVASGSGNLAKP